MTEQTHPPVVKCRICGEPTEWKYEGCCPNCQALSSSADGIMATGRHSTREIVKDHTGQDGWSVCGPRALGWNPSWVKAVDYDALKAENARLRAAIESLRQQHDVCDDCWYTCPLALDEDGDSKCCNTAEGFDRTACTCGASRANAVIDEALGQKREVER